MPKYAPRKFLASLCLILGSSLAFLAATEVHAGGALKFDGVDDRLTLPSVDFGSDSFTIELWIKAEGTGSTQVILSSWRGYSKVEGYELRINASGRFEWEIGLGAKQQTITTITYASGEWQHISVYRHIPADDTVLSMGIYIDGVSRGGIATGIGGGLSIDRTILPSLPSIGGPSPSIGGTEYYSGLIDDFRMWDDPPFIIHSPDWDEELSGDEDGLLAYFDFDDAISDGDNRGIASFASKTGSDFSASFSGFERTGSSSNVVASSVPFTKKGSDIKLLATSRTLGDTGSSMTATSDSPGAISYSSSNTAVATINSSTGELTLLSAGTTTITASQSASGVYIAESASAELRVKSSNAAPTLSGAPASATVAEDTESEIALGDLTFTDTDSDRLSVTLSVNTGTLSAPTASSSIVASLSSATSITLYGYPADINAYLDSYAIRYLTAADDSGTGVATLTVNANDGSTNPSLATIRIDATDTAESPVLAAAESPALASIAINAGDDDGSAADDDDDGIDNSNNPGTSVAAIVVDGSITDADAVGAVPEAIAVIAVDNSAGLWQYSVDNGSSWTAFSDSSGEVSLVTSARLLDGSASGSSTNRVRYVPNLNSTAGATLTFRAWDKSSGTVGSTADASSFGGATAFSSASDTASVTLSGGNSFPTATTPPATVTSTEDSTTNLPLSSIALADADGDTLTLTLTLSAGTFGVPGDEAGVTESRSGDATQVTLSGSASALTSYLDTAANLTFTPAADGAGTGYATLSFQLADGTITRSVGSSSINVTNINDRPVLDTAGAPTLTSRPEDNTGRSNAGNSVASVIVDGSITDPDGVTLGIAVTWVDNSNGVWQYNLTPNESNPEDDWRDFTGSTGEVDLSTAARLLRGYTSGSYLHMIRFVPAANYNGTATFKYRAWDMSSGTDGSTASVVGAGVGSAFSANEETATITITPVNDAPTLSYASMSRITEDLESSLYTGAIAVYDIDSTTITLTGTASQGVIESVASGASVGGGVTATKVGTDGFSLVGSLADVNTYLSTFGNIRYTPPADFYGDTGIDLVIVASDGAGSVSGSKPIRVSAVNDAPVLNPSVVNLSTTVLQTVSAAAATDYTDAENEGFLVTSLYSDTSIVDVDSPRVGIVVTAVDNTNGRWQYGNSYHVATPSRPTTYARTWTNFSNSSGVVNLGSASVAMGDQSLAVREQIRFQPNSNFTGTATLTFRAWDYSNTTATYPGPLIVDATSGGGSTPYSEATDTVTVRSMAATAVSNLEGDSPRYVNGLDAPLDVGGDAVITDDDSTRMRRLYISWLSGFKTGDQLDIDTSGGDISVTGSNIYVDGTLIGTVSTSLPSTNMYIALNTDASIERTQKLLRSLVYRNTVTSEIHYTDRELRLDFTDDDSNITSVIVYPREVAGDNDGDISAATGVDESADIVLSTSRNTVDEAIAVMDFTISDGGTRDGLPLNITRIGVALSGTMPYSERITLKFTLSGPDLTNRIGSWGSGSSLDAAYSFSSSSLISIPDGGSETYTLKVYADPSKSYTTGTTVITTVDGDDSYRWKVANAGTEMGTTAAVTNGSGFTVRVDASRLGFTTEPSGSVSGVGFTTVPVVTALDAGGGVDTSFTEDVTLSTTGAGTLTGTTTVKAVAGVATFSDVVYSATADGESFTLVANDEADVDGDLPSASSAEISSDVVATTLEFTRQPPSLRFVSGVRLSLTSPSPILSAVNAQGLVDTDFTSNFTLGVINGAGTVSLADSSRSGTSIFRAATGGVIESWPDLSLMYTNTGSSPHTFNFQATASGLSAAVSDEFTSVVADRTAGVTAASGISEPVVFPSTARSIGEAVAVMDFTISDGGTGASDGLPTKISRILIDASGSSTSADRSAITLVLSGAGVSRSMSFSGASWDTGSGTDLGIEIPDGGSADFTVSAYFSRVTSVTSGATLTISVDGDSDFFVESSGTRMASTSPVTTELLGTSFSVTATRLVFGTASSSIVSGVTMSSRTVRAVDAVSNVDTSFTETITLSAAGDGVLSGTTSVAAVAGIATFSDLVYSASADKETFVLTADDDALVVSDLDSITGSSISADVVATKLAFATEPAPLTVFSGQELTLTTPPVVRALDNDDLVDVDFSSTVTLSETGGAGSALIAGSGDTDADAATLSLSASAGEVSFAGVTVNYSTAGDSDETFALRASSSSLSTADSASITAEVPNSDGSLATANGVTEPVAIDTTRDSASEAIDVFDFMISDGGGDDATGITVTALNINVSGGDDAARGKLTWSLRSSSGTVYSMRYDSDADQLQLSGASIAIASGGSETFTLSAYYNDNTGLTEGTAFVLSLTGNSDVSVVGTKIGSTEAVSNGSGSRVSVVATALVFSQAPAGTVAGAALSTQPVIEARDAFGNVDIDFAETITLSSSGAGTLAGDVELSAVSGVATFSGLSYKPSVDGETVSLVADDEADLSIGTFSDLSSVSSASLTLDVVATRLAFLDEPAPLNLVKSRATDLSVVPRIAAVNADGAVDADATGTVLLAEINGEGSVVLDVTGDSDSNSATASIALVAGIATFAEMEITYNNASDSNEDFNLSASMAGLVSANSAQMFGVVADVDADLRSAPGVSEPVALPTTANSADAALSLLDFILSDGATVDSLALSVTALRVNMSGDASDTVRSNIKFLLDGPDASVVEGSYDADSDVLTFSPLTLSIANGESETYRISAYFTDNSGVVDNSTLILSIDGDTDLTVGGEGTQFGSTTAVNNGSGTTLVVAASQLVFTTAPAGSVSGSSLTTQPVVEARDAAGNRDLDFAEVVSLSPTAGGSLRLSAGGAAVATAVGGVAAFSDVTYFASEDKQSVALVADDDGSTGGDLPSVTSSAFASEVVATKLALTTPPSPAAIYLGDASGFAGGPVVSAVNALGIVDTDANGTVMMSEIEGPGAITVEVEGDRDADEATATLAMNLGRVSFAGSRIIYTPVVEEVQTFKLRFTSAGLSAVVSTEITASPIPPPVDKTIREVVEGGGRVITDPEIVKGGELRGGEVCGTAKSSGRVTDVTLCKGAEIVGGEVGGSIAGDPESPATLTDVTILPGSRLSNVRVGADVILLRGVIIGENVSFDNLINVPGGVMLTDTLSKIAVPGQSSRTALDLRSALQPGAATAPRTNYLELMNDEAVARETEAAVDQEVDGSVRLEFQDAESRLVPVSMRKTEDEENGFYFDDDGNLSIRLGVDLEIIMYPMFNDDEAVVGALERDYSSLSLQYDGDSNFVIGSANSRGDSPTEPRYIGRAGIQATRAISADEEGFVIYPNPLLENLDLVSFISRNEDGVLLEQTMTPVPLDWFGFKNRLLEEADVTSVKISSQGVISVVYRNQIWTMMSDYAVMPNAAAPSVNRPIVFINAGDLNGDGETDYHIYYPSGERQSLYIVPR